MREVQATEAKRRLAELLRAVECGETMAITRYGKPVAHLVPARAEDRASRESDRALSGAPRLVEARYILYG